jgi:hypothetical protein
LPDIINDTRGTGKDQRNEQDGIRKYEQSDGNSQGSRGITRQSQSFISTSVTRNGRGNVPELIADT